MSILDDLFNSGKKAVQGVATTIDDLFGSPQSISSPLDAIKPGVVKTAENAYGALKSFGNIAQKSTQAIDSFNTAQNKKLFSVNDQQAEQMTQGFKKQADMVMGTIGPSGAAKSLINRVQSSASKKELEGLIDYIRLKKPFNQSTEELIGKYAERFGITTPKLGVVANQFEKVLNNSKKLVSKGDDLLSQAKGKSLDEFVSSKQHLFSKLDDISSNRQYILNDNNLQRNLTELKKDGIPLNSDGTITLYRGQDKRFGGDDSFRALSSWTTNKNLAKKISNNVYEIKVNPADMVFTSKMGDGITFQNLTNLVKVNDKYVVEPSQLTDIWNKANTPLKSVGEKIKEVSISDIIKNDEFTTAKNDVKNGIKSFLDIPVLLGTDKNGKYFIKDGNHRVVQAIDNGLTKIKAVFDESIYKKMEKDFLSKNNSDISGEKLSGLKGVVNNIYKKYNDVKLSVYENGDNISLDKIVVPREFRSSGIGTNIMKDLIKYADDNNKTIKLTPSGDFGGSVSRLKEFYKKFGFVENKGKNKDYQIRDLFYRRPK